jgi:hypothetical protein
MPDSENAYNISKLPAGSPKNEKRNWRIWVAIAIAILVAGEWHFFGRISPSQNAPKQTGSRGVVPAGGLSISTFVATKSDIRVFLIALGTVTLMQGQLARDQAELSEARIDLTRQQLAFARNAIPKQQLDDQQEVVHQDEGAVQNDQGQLQNEDMNFRS